MRVRDRAKRGIAHRREVDFDPGAPAQFPNVMEPEPHDEIVRMLPVDNGLPVGGFAGLKEQRVAAIRDGSRLQAQHQIDLERSALA